MKNCIENSKGVNLGAELSQYKPLLSNSLSRPQWALCSLVKSKHPLSSCLLSFYCTIIFLGWTETDVFFCLTIYTYTTTTTDSSEEKKLLFGLILLLTQGRALAEPGGPWCLTFALGCLGNLSVSYNSYAGHRRFYRFRAPGFLQFSLEHSLMLTSIYA